MRRLFTVLILSLLLSAETMAGGGPDAFGYVWYDDTDTSIVTYSWIDISTRSGVVTIPSGGNPPVSPGLQDDNSFGLISLGFDFHYYWGDFNQLKVGSNGWLGFSNIGNIASCFPTMTNAAPPHNFIAPMMADLNFGYDGSIGTPNPGSAYYWTNNVDTFIITYENVPFWTPTSPYTGSNTFQVILCGTDSSITYQYEQVEQSINYNCGGVGTTDWNYVQGIKAINGSTGLTVNPNHSTLASDMSAIKFFFPDSIALQIQDAAATGGLNIDNGGEFVMQGEDYVPRAYISNVGNVDINSATTVNAVVAGLGYTSSITIPAILQGQTFLVQFPDTLNATNAGSFSFNISITNSNDANPSNNTNTTELTVIAPNSNGQLRLSYASAATPGGGISWGGAATNDGGGIEIVPPFYPMVIRSMEHFVTADPNSTGYSGEIRLPDVNGDPGAVVRTVTVPSGSFTANTWHNAPLSDSVTIDSGSVFASWIMGGPGITLGAEDPAANPNGNRTFEIIAGAWAPYRTAGSDAYIAILVDTPATQAPVGLQETFTGNVLLYPNPSTGYFTIEGETQLEGNVNFVISDQLGRRIKSVSTAIRDEKIQMTVDLSDQPSGVYYLMLGSDRTERVFKLVKN